MIHGGVTESGSHPGSSNPGGLVEAGLTETGLPADPPGVLDERPPAAPTAEPVTLAEIERGRGVKVSRALLDKLMEAGMIRPGIRRTGTGRAATYSTTDAFLAHFRLDALSDMPTPEELLSRDLPVDTPE